LFRERFSFARDNHPVDIIPLRGRSRKFSGSPRGTPTAAFPESSNVLG
jgi:hypothetical protein